MRSWSVCAPIAMALLVVSFTSCGQSGPKLNPVQGKVFFNGQPAEGAKVVLQPVGGPNAANPVCFGTVDADGTFVIHSESGAEGAVAGDYLVLVSWYPGGRDAANPANKLPAKYADATQELLKANVKEGPNELPPFELTP